MLNVILCFILHVLQKQKKSLEEKLNYNDIEKWISLQILCKENIENNSWRKKNNAIEKWISLQNIV